MSVDQLVVSSTTDSEDAPRALASGVVEARLGACAQVVRPITSVYRWQDAVQDDQEHVRVTIAALRDQVDAVARALAAAAP